MTTTLMPPSATSLVTGCSYQLFIISFTALKSHYIRQNVFPTLPSTFFFMILKILLCRKLFFKVLDVFCRIFSVINKHMQVHTHTCWYAVTHMYRNTHMHACIHTHIYTHTNTYMHVHTYTCTNRHTNKQTNTHT